MAHRLRWMNCSNADLEDFLTEQWEDTLLTKVRQRAYLQDAEAFSVKITFKLMREFTPQELVLLRIHLAGGVTTGKVATNFVSSQDDGICVIVANLIDCNIVFVHAVRPRQPERNRLSVRCLSKQRMRN